MSTTPCEPATWPGRVNTHVPAPPTPATPSEALFASAIDRERYWLPDPPGSAFPGLQAFWDRMGKGITEYRCAKSIKGPEQPCIGPLDLPADGEVAAPALRMAHAGRESRSPNWSGASVAATRHNTLTQVVACWNEPAVQTSGNASLDREFRSSIWTGFNGHAAYRDASLPQIGTMQRIVHDGTAWQTGHWVWFEWWANVRGRELPELLLPVYLDLDVHEGDAVLCRVDLIASDPVHFPAEDFPYVARMCICIERLAADGSVASKVLVMPFVVYPPELGPKQRRVEVAGSTANWIAELPMNVCPREPPFLLPRAGAATASDNRVTFTHCVAASAAEPGEPLVAEHTLEVSRRFHLYNTQPERRPTLSPIASTGLPQVDKTTFSIQVDGNDA